MKLEKRDNSVFVSHEGLSVFFNKRVNRRESWLNINVTVRDKEGRWYRVGDMDVKTEAALELADLLKDLFLPKIMA